MREIGRVENEGDRGLRMREVGVENEGDRGWRMREIGG